MKKCQGCKKKLNDILFPEQWNKKHQKYYKLSLCRPCFRKMRRETYNDEGIKKSRDKYWSKGYYGWNNGWEKYMSQKDTEYFRELERTEWVLKVENLNEVSRLISDKFFQFRKFDKNKEKKIEKNLFARVIKERNRTRKYKKNENPKDIVSEVFLYQINMLCRQLFFRSYESEWSKKIYNLIKHHRIVN
jgi:hypothetical protein